VRALREVWGQTLADLGDTNPSLLVLDPDVGNSTKADIFAAAYPERFLQLGIAEQNAIGTAVGLASQGFVPWVSSFSVFVTHRAIDQIRMLVAQTGANVKIAGAYAGLLTGLTGRTHQIRVHFAHLGHPLVGDWLYGKEESYIARPALHSYFLKIKHPVSGEQMEFQTNYPQDMQELIKSIKI